jgi:hypothetical protein
MDEKKIPACARNKKIRFSTAGVVDIFTLVREMRTREGAVNLFGADSEKPRS